MTIKEKVLSLLQNESLSLNEIAQKVGGNRGSVCGEVRSLSKEGRIMNTYGKWKLCKKNILTKKQIENLKGKDIAIACEEPWENYRERVVKGKIVSTYGGKKWEKVTGQFGEKN